MFKQQGIIGRSVSPIFFKGNNTKQERMGEKGLRLMLKEKDHTIDALKEQV